MIFLHNTFGQRQAEAPSPFLSRETRSKHILHILLADTFPIVIDARYNLGLTKVIKESEEGYKDLKNNVIQLTVGYKFAL